MSLNVCLVDVYQRTGNVIYKQIVLINQMKLTVKGKLQVSYYGPLSEKTCLWCLQITKAQTGLCLCAVLSAPMLFFQCKVYLNLPQANFQFLASLCSCGGCVFSVLLCQKPIRQVLLRRGPYYLFIYGPAHKALLHFCTIIYIQKPTFKIPFWHNPLG